MNRTTEQSWKMTPANIVTKQFFLCPHCGENTKHEVRCELYVAEKQIDWEDACLKCNKSYRYGYSHDNKPVTAALTTPPNSAKILSLLVLPPQEEPVYFIIEDTGYDRDKKGVIDLDQEYYYNSHSCPTNWINGIRRIIIGDDSDPHGLLEFVRATLKTDADVIRTKVRLDCGYGPDQRGSSDDHTEYMAATAIFPEIIPTIPEDMVFENTAPGANGLPKLITE